MSIYSNENIRKIAKLTPRELPHLVQNRENNGVYSIHFAILCISLFYMLALGFSLSHFLFSVTLIKGILAVYYEFCLLRWIMHAVMSFFCVFKVLLINWFCPKIGLDCFANICFISDLKNWFLILNNEHCFNANWSTSQ